MPRRKPGTLLPLESEILHVALELRTAGETKFHGFGLAQTMREDGASGLIGHGTLYKALGRLEEMGLVTSRWEQEPPPGRPRRRSYELTATGVEAARTPRPVTSDPTPRGRVAPGIA